MTTNREAIKEGCRSDDGDLIKSIIYRSQSLVVYFTVEGKPGFDCEPNLIDRKRQTVHAHDNLTATIKLSLKGSSQKIAYQLLGFALTNALVSETDEPSAQMEVVADFIAEQASNQARMQYVFGSTLCLIVLGSVSVMPFRWTPDMIIIGLSALAGGAGAWASIVQRAHRLTPELLAPHSYHLMTGVIRICLGGIFGGIFAVLCKSNIVLGLASENLYAIYALAFLAGLNERFVPEMLEHVSGNIHTKRETDSNEWLLPTSPEIIQKNKKG